MAYNENFSWPMSGQDGPDFEWEHVPIEMPVPLEIPQILPISPDDHEGEEGTIPSVRNIQLEGKVKGEVKGEVTDDPTDDTEKVRSFEWEEVKGLPDKKFMDDLFDKLGNEIIIEDENGKNRHFYYLFGEHEDQKHYRCINKDCNKGLIVEMRNPEETIEPPSSSRGSKEGEKEIQEGEEDDH